MLKDFYTYTGKEPPEPTKIALSVDHYALIDGIDVLTAALTANTTALTAAHEAQQILLEKIRLASLGMVRNG